MSFRTKRCFVATGVFFLGIVFTLASPQDFVNFLMGGFIGLSLIWFSEGFGNFTGWWGSSHGSFTRVDKTSPPILIEFFGWGVLLSSFLVSI
jgi:hypothetical protein